MEANAADRESDNESGLLHGTNVLLDLVKPWWNKRQTRTVSADSYFASVQACDELMKRNLRFIGVVKTATKGFCMKRLSELELVERGDWKGYYTYTQGAHSREWGKFAFIWMDRDRRLFHC